MALNKSKSRPITVDDNKFRYIISISWHDGGKFDFNITVQSEAHNGCKLLLKGLVTRDFWLDFSDNLGEEIDNTDYPTITPKHISAFIMRAINEGWEYSSTGKDFILKVSNENLFK